MEGEVNKIMKTSSELKMVAKEGLKGYRGQAIGAMLLSGIVSCVPFCSPAMMVGYSKYNLKLVRKQEKSATDVFDGFNVFGKALWLYIIMAFFLYLWSLLFLIPGIVKAFAYSMSQFYLAENPEIRDLFKALSIIEYTHARVHKNLAGIKEDPKLSKLDYSKYNTDAALLELAAKRELHAVEYYKKYKSSINNKVIGSIFDALAEVETEHIELTEK
jgi:hypothetical protein